MYSILESLEEHVFSSDVNEDNQSENSLLTNDDISQTNEQLPLFIPHAIEFSRQRLVFTLDVKPYQRHIYMTDQYNVRLEKSNGRIARIQGLKDDHQKMLQILPKLRVRQQRTTFISRNSLFYRFQRKLFNPVLLCSLQWYRKK